MKSESYLTLHRQQHNWNVPRSRNVVNTSVKQSMWHQWLNFSFTMLREAFFFFAKKTKITIYSTILLPRVTSSTVLESITTHTHAFAWAQTMLITWNPFWRTLQNGRRCYSEEKNGGSDSTPISSTKVLWVWNNMRGIINDRIFILGWTNPLRWLFGQIKQ